MTMPLYASPEQLMRDRSEYARKGIARGRSVVALKYSGGVLFVAENPSATLHKVSEIYDRIGFAATGRYSEYDGLRRGGIRHVDLWGLANDPRDVSARQLANVYAQTLASVFSDQLKPFEVELCVAEVGATAAGDQLYRLTYDGSIVDEPSYLVMGGQTEPISNKMKETYEEDMSLEAALAFAVAALSAGVTNGDNGIGKLEVAVLDRGRPKRAFRRIEGAALTALLPSESSESAEQPEEPTESEPTGSDEA
ncbi:proteasome subunit alpha [Actinophytocola algeriensis]|uniref:Proteasome subunit alpha n=1 Tax=Actinophytocola algeriensis TaxID=1768010 RepID=A0A7W7VD23_9PSEU|nr:proteasome subunit alpha [Actinophytocola algeriensis]MBB4905697.1 proteasome alpha subunit [Actinophytocola algeriensis]MBE1472618.1 proteasome alpha subunit [Actinophytocola algeriensis]